MKRVVIPRYQPMEVSQEYLDAHRHLLQTKWWRIDGDAGVTVDNGNDGVPDEGWTKKDIVAWMTGQGLEVGGYATKATLLKSVAAFLNPEPVAEPVEEAEPTTETGDE